MRRLIYVETSVWSRLADPPDLMVVRLTESFLREASLRHRVLIVGKYT